jgi:hypothetical protein
MKLFFKKLAVILLVVVSVFSSIQYLTETIQSWDPGLITNDGVYDWDARLAALRADLPADVKIVGYVSDWDVRSEYNYPNSETEYVLTQYSMAPVIVNRGDNDEWLIVNLSPKDFETWLATQPSNLKVTQYPQGLFLVQMP